ncbi:MAG: energy transducer TonB [Terriglobia bacterium]
MKPQQQIQPVREPAVLETTTQHFPDFHLPDLVDPYRPFRSLVTSLFLHLVIIGLILFARFSPKRRRLIDFDKEKITYYQVNAQFPSIAPSPTPPQADPPNPVTKKSLAENKAEVEVSIHPEIQKPLEIVVEQPDVPSVDVLPKLALPNILLRSAKAEPAKAPLVLEKPKFAMLEEPIVTPPVEAQPPSVMAESSISQKLKLALPARPTPVVPMIDEPKSDLPVEPLHSASGADLLVYSNQPALPKGELAVPKVNSTGKIQTQTTVKAPAGAEELGKADIVIPGISIKSQAPVVNSGAGVGVIQAPPPPKPAGEIKEDNKKKAASDQRAKSRSLADLPGIQVSKLEPLQVQIPESPLKELERQGKTIYSTSMNAPNFTSKRGSWIFRFAEVDGEPSSLTPKPHASGSEDPLTAPSATVKVDPKYPPEVMREKIEGHVILYAILRKDGAIDPDSVRIIQKLDPRLDVSARDALIHWKFKPSLKNGEPVEIQAEITIPFYFRDDWFKR